MATKASSKSKKATYFQSGGNEPVELEIIKTNSDKTVDLGIDGEVKVARCKVHEDDKDEKGKSIPTVPRPGTCKID